MTDATSLLSPAALADYLRDGHVIVRNVFRREEMDELAAESLRLLNGGNELINPLNLRCRFMPHHETGEKLFEVFDPINDLSPVCTQFCNDPRIHGILETIFGEPACLFKEKLIIKPPGAMGYNLHQDIPLSWEVFPRSFMTVLIPIDRCTRENGCTEVYSGYHADFLSDDPETYMMPRHVVDDSRRVFLEMEPGDVALFHGLTPHCSEPNRSSEMRRTFYVSYNRLSDGGDQRADHYQRFHTRLRQHLESQLAQPMYFR